MLSDAGEGEFGRGTGKRGGVWPALEPRDSQSGLSSPLGCESSDYTFLHCGCQLPQHLPKSFACERMETAGKSFSCRRFSLGLCIAVRKTTLVVQTRITQDPKHFALTELCSVRIMPIPVIQKKEESAKRYVFAPNPKAWVCWRKNP